MLKKKGRNFVYVIVFLLSFILFDRALFYLIRAEENKLYTKKDILSIFNHRQDFNRNFFRIPKGTYDTLIMGSSRTHRGIHPYYLYKDLHLKAFKNASARTRPRFNYFFYEQYKKYAGIPKVVIYGIDYFMFTVKTNKAFFRKIAAESKEPTLAAGVSLLLANKTQNDEFLIDILEKFSSAAGVEMATGRRNQKTDLPPAAYFIDPFVGYGRKNPSASQRPPQFKKYRYRPYPGLEGVWFFKLLKKLHKDGVAVALVVLPSHIGTYESNFQREAFLTDIRRLVRGLRNVHIFDYDRPEKFRLDNENYFLDGGYGLSSSHLSDQGACALNRMLGADLKSRLGL